MLERKDILNARLQLLTISVTLILGSGTGFGFLFYKEDLGVNVYTQCFLLISLLALPFSSAWFVYLLANINEDIKT